MSVFNISISYGRTCVQCVHKFSIFFRNNRVAIWNGNDLQFSVDCGKWYWIRGHHLEWYVPNGKILKSARSKFDYYFFFFSSFENVKPAALVKRRRWPIFHTQFFDCENYRIRIINGTHQLASTSTATTAQKSALKREKKKRRRESNWIKEIENWLTPVNTLNWWFLMKYKFYTWTQTRHYCV